ncbi:acyl-CoA dehydrogenase family protein [Gordonia sp. VNK21]|uniref:acyl-CoA dehydrogenase family protein n=1 Tax=Gordonia sp. VNK21 TaxID=3382483 RepID=UPI0038D4C103
MDFLLDDMHTDLAQTCATITERAGGPELARSWAEGEREPALAVYRQLAESGITGLVVSEDHGGSGAGATEMVVAAEQLGRACLPGPVAETVAVVPTALVAAGASAALTELLAGTAPATCALAPVTPRAADTEDSAVYLIADGAVWTGTPGETARTVDPSRSVADVTAGTQLGTGVDLESALDLGALATAAQLLGLGSVMLELAADYAKNRTQFGRAIGSFQAVKHHLADVAIAVEMARPLVWGAALGLDGLVPDGTPVRLDVSAAKVAAGDAAYLAARRSLQVLGAIGYTAEHDLSLYLTKTRALLTAWGTPAWHRRRILEAL